MFSILIVDDEMIARVGIKSLIAWRENGFEVIGECENGHKALQMIREISPDIVITDIKMPVLNGIELIKSVKNEGLRTKFIVLSSHDDFLYVKDAIKLGAEDYILKLEMEPETLLEILKNTAEKIQCESNEKKKKQENEKYYSDDIQVLKTKFIKGILNGTFKSSDQIEERLNFFSIDLPQKNIICMTIRIDNNEMFMNHNEKDLDLLNCSIVSVIDEVLNNYGKSYSCTVREWNYGVILSQIFTQEALENDKKGIISRITKSISGILYDSLNLSASIGTSDVIQCYIDIYEAYRQAVNMLEGDKQSIFKINQSSISIPLEEYLKELENAFQNVDVNKIINEFSTIKRKIASFDGISKKYMNGIVHTIIFIVNTFARYYSIDLTNIWGIENDPYNDIVKLSDAKQYAEWVAILQEKIYKLFNADNDSKMVIVRAKQFIKANFKDQLSLEGVAEHLGLSANYFSRIFSKETGESFIEYVTQIKIETAKSLMKNTNYKMYEVCEMVGYDNPHYFSRIFKKVTGVSPIEYKAEIANSLK